MSRDLHKRYENVAAVRGITFEVRGNECLVLLGPNGAGKSSTLGMISGAVRRNEGHLSVLGMDPDYNARQIKRQLGVMSQGENLDSRLTVLQNLDLYARYHDIPASDRRRRAEELLELFSLTSKSHARVHTLSGGTRRRLQLARALINKPRLLLLDEPTAGLDPHGRIVIWNKLRTLQSLGTAVILSTHYMEEAERLCDRVLIMDLGVIIAEGTPHALIRSLPAPEIVEIIARHSLLQEAIGHIAPLLNNWRLHENRAVAMTHNAQDVARALTRTDLFPNLQIAIRPSSLEDVFLHLTGRDISQDISRQDHRNSE